jgi:hypothetical protein
MKSLYLNVHDIVQYLESIYVANDIYATYILVKSNLSCSIARLIYKHKQPRDTYRTLTEFLTYYKSTN